LFEFSEFPSKHYANIVNDVVAKIW